MVLNKLQAKKLSYGTTRSLDDVKYIVIHYTGNSGDTAENNAKYFANGNTRQAGAHFFVDRDGNIWRSVKMRQIAWSVGGFHSNENGAGSYYKKCTNANSISIELCDTATKDASPEQIAATNELIKYIQKHCENAKKVIRHWDVNGKECPKRYISEKKWKALKKKITE